jgi:hypothetical protein
MERSEKHQHKESRESIGEEFVEHHPTLNTSSSRKQVKTFIDCGKV